MSIMHVQNLKLKIIKSLQTHVVCVSFNFIISVFTETGLTKENGKMPDKAMVLFQQTIRKENMQSYRY